MRLQCIRDNCPKTRTHGFVNYKRCVNCEFYQGQIEFATVECDHPQANDYQDKGYPGKIKDIFPALCKQV